MDNLRHHQRNIEGYSNDFTNNIYEYARPPSCQYYGGGQYMQFNRTINRCQAVTRGVSSSCSTSGTRRVNLVTNQVTSREWGKNREVITTSGTYPWSFVTQIFHIDQPGDGGERKIFEVMISTLPKRTLGSVASLLAEPSIKEILIGTTSSGISYHLRDIYSICRCCWNVVTYMKSSQWENWYHFFCRKVSFLTDPHCRFRGVGQGIKQIFLYPWYPLFQAQWGRCDQPNHQT